jgi:hypothetical protein
MKFFQTLFSCLDRKNIPIKIIIYVYSSNYEYKNIQGILFIRNTVGSMRPIMTITLYATALFIFLCLNDFIDNLNSRFIKKFIIDWLLLAIKILASSYVPFFLPYSSRLALLKYFYSSVLGTFGGLLKLGLRKPKFIIMYVKTEGIFK